MHKIDLKNFDIRTDMAIDLISEKDNKREKIIDNIKISKITINKNSSLKKKGIYLTLEFEDVTDTDVKDKVSNVFKKELLKILKQEGYNNKYKTMIVGLGNNLSTPDSLGPKVIDKTIVTYHLYNMKVLSKKFSPTISFSPGVTSTTGIETSDYIKSIVSKIKPDILIVIDALKSNSISRVNKSIQITNTGISPGSGIQNKRKEISKKVMGIPVIAIGVPTVVDASVIVSDTINYIKKEIADDNLFGLIGKLSDDERRKIASLVLSSFGYNLMVTPKEIDFVIEKLSDVISYGINNCLHKL